MRSSRLFRKCLRFGLACIACAAPLCSSALNWHEKQRIDQLIDQKIRVDGIPGAAYAVIESGVVVHQGAFGFANVELKAPATPSVVFRSGSLVKPMTATAILQLAAAGRLDLDAPIQRYCETFPPKSKPVTARALLSHTGGVRSYNMPWKVFEAELYSSKRYKSISDALSIFAADPLKYAPGHEHVYSSYGYNLLGCAIEGAAKQPFMDYLEQHIFSVAGMRHTVADVPERIVLNRAAGYTRKRKGRLQNERYVDMSNKIPGGGLLTNVFDLAKFAIAYMEGKLLDKQQRNLAATPAELDTGELIDYGLGWGIDQPRAGEPADRIYHGGVTPGLSGILYLQRSTQNGFVFLSNLYGVKGREELARGVLHIVHGQYHQQHY